MQFERIKKSHKREITIGGLILVCVISAITITTTRAKYKLTDDIPLVKGTINYKEPDMRIMAINLSEDGTNYNIVDEIPTSGYKLNTTKSICKIATTDTKDEEVTIEYKEGKVNILGVTKKGTRCYLYFDKKNTDTIHVSFGDIEVNRTTPDFSKSATTDEGVYKVSDPIYGSTSYYWRGASTTNHVIFANKCWRIVRINGDGTTRLIYNGPVKTGNTCAGNGENTESIVRSSIDAENSYVKNEGQDSNSSYVGWTYTLGSQRTTSGTSSNAKIQTEKWYNANITGTNASKVADGKFCNDRNVQSGSSWTATGNTFNYAINRRLYVDYAPTLECNPGDVYTIKVGAITADEVMYAGGMNEDNTSYYLYNGQFYWTMTPFNWYSGGNTVVMCVHSSGRPSVYNVYAIYLGFRPVINLKSDVEFQAGGNGTQNNPYVVV